MSVNQLLFYTAHLCSWCVSVRSTVFLQIVATFLVVVGQSQSGVGQCRGDGPTASAVPRVEHHVAGCTDADPRLERTDGLKLAAQSLNEVRKRRTATGHEDVL